MIKILSLRGEQISSDGCLSNWPLGRRLKGGLEFSASLKISRIANTFSSQIEAQEKGRTQTLSHNHHVVVQRQYLQPSVADEDTRKKGGIPFVNGNPPNPNPNVILGDVLRI